MTTAKTIQMILARQLASCVVMPILLVDAKGTLIFYNEPAETFLNERFEETGEIAADEWNRLVTLADEDHNPIPLEDRPMRSALTQRRPISRTLWTRSGDRDWRHLHVTAFPLVGEGDELFGVMSIFWEV